MGGGERVGRRGGAGRDRRAEVGLQPATWRTAALLLLLRLLLHRGERIHGEGEWTGKAGTGTAYWK